MTTDPKSQEVRWQVIKAMLDEFPALKEKVKDYVNNKVYVHSSKDGVLQVET